MRKTHLKTCARCGEDKKLIEFHRNSQRPDGLAPWCATCTRKYHQERRHYHGTGIGDARRVCSKLEASIIEQRKVITRIQARLAQLKQLRLIEKDLRDEREREANNYYRELNRVKFPEKETAHKAVLNAINRGDLIPKPCEICGTHKKVEAHHDDYLKPLDVRWLCRTHHRGWHKIHDAPKISSESA